MLARFIPLVRTVLNPLAGTVGVPMRIFTLWQVLGGLVWSVGLTLAGYALGSRIPAIRSSPFDTGVTKACSIAASMRSAACPKSARRSVGEAPR